MDFSPNDVKRLTGNGIYIFYKDDVIFYIGATTRGLRRCFSVGHPAMDRAIKDSWSLIFVPTETAQYAFRLEEIWIREFRPAMNRFRKSNRTPLQIVPYKPWTYTIDNQLDDVHLMGRWNYHRQLKPKSK